MAQTDNKNQPNDIPVTIISQYIRDLSFENPAAPASLRHGKGAPETDINIGMDARKIPDPEIDNHYEVVLSVRAEASREKNTLFILELQYAVSLSIGQSVPENMHHAVLFIEIPKLAFPFVRQILSDVTQNGGFPPLMLAPVDFNALYMQRFGKDNAPEQEIKAEQKK